MFVPLREFGRHGLHPDHPAHDRPVGAWTRGRNVKFNGRLARRALEPGLVPNTALLTEELIWMHQFWDGAESRLAAASATNLYIYNTGTESWDQAGTGFADTGYWQSEAFGTTVIFNNGEDPPQVFNGDTQMFVPLPKWGELTSGTVAVKARFILVYKNFLVAGNITEGGDEQPNTVWWSDAITDPDLWKTAEAPTWDYEVATNLAGKNPIGLEDGPLQWGAPLGEALCLYTTYSSHAMLLSRGTEVFNFRGLFQHGCAGVYCAAAFYNYNLVVDSTSIYMHDGNTVRQVAEDRVKNTFFQDLNALAGSPAALNFNQLVAGSAENPFSSIRMTTNPATREVYIQYDSKGDTYPIPNPAWTEGGEEPDRIQRPVRTALVYNYEDDNWTFVDASAEKDVVFQPGGAGETTERTLVPCNCMIRGLAVSDNTTWADWQDANTLWSDLGATSWAQLFDDTSTTELYWLLPDGVYYGNQVAQSDLVIKDLFLEKINIDLDELSPDMTTNFWKHLRQMYPHIDGSGVLEVEVGWSPNLVIPPDFTENGVLDLDMNLNSPQAKVDFRTTGRYLALRFNFNRCDTWRLTGADVDVVPAYGR